MTMIATTGQNVIGKLEFSVPNLAPNLSEATKTQYTITICSLLQ